MAASSLSPRRVQLRRHSPAAPAAPHSRPRGETTAVLRDVAYVLHLTRTVRDGILADQGKRGA